MVNYHLVLVFLVTICRVSCYRLETSQILALPGDANEEYHQQLLLFHNELRKSLRFHGSWEQNGYPNGKPGFPNPCSGNKPKPGCANHSGSNGTSNSNPSNTNGPSNHENKVPDNGNHGGHGNNNGITQWNQDGYPITNGGGGSWGNGGENGGGWGNEGGNGGGWGNEGGNGGGWGNEGGNGGSWGSGGENGGGWGNSGGCSGNGGGNGGNVGECNHGGGGNGQGGGNSNPGSGNGGSWNNGGGSEHGGQGGGHNGIGGAGGNPNINVVIDVHVNGKPARNPYSNNKKLENNQPHNKSLKYNSKRLLDESDSARNRKNKKRLGSKWKRPNYRHATFNFQRNNDVQLEKRGHFIIDLCQGNRLIDELIHLTQASDGRRYKRNQEQAYSNGVKSSNYGYSISTVTVNGKKSTVGKAWYCPSHGPCQLLPLQDLQKFKFDQQFPPDFSLYNKHQFGPPNHFDGYAKPWQYHPFQQNQFLENHKKSWQFYPFQQNQF